MANIEYIKVKSKAKAKSRSHANGSKAKGKSHSKSKSKAEASVVIKLGSKGSSRKRNTTPSQPKQQQQPIIINNVPAPVPLSDVILATQANRPPPQPATFNQGSMSRDVPYIPNNVDVPGDIPMAAIPNVAQTNRALAFDNTRDTLHDEIQEDDGLARATLSPQDNTAASRLF